MRSLAEKFHYRPFVSVVAAGLLFAACETSNIIHDARRKRFSCNIRSHVEVWAHVPGTLRTFNCYTCMMCIRTATAFACVFCRSTEQQYENGIAIANSPLHGALKGGVRGRLSNALNSCAFSELSASELHFAQVGERSTSVLLQLCACKPRF